MIGWWSFRPGSFAGCEITAIKVHFANYLGEAKWYIIPRFYDDKWIVYVILHSKMQLLEHTDARSDLTSQAVSVHRHDPK